MRIGWDMDQICCVELAKRLEEVGVCAIAVHGRTRKQMYEGKADWSYIKQVKKQYQFLLLVMVIFEAKKMLCVCWKKQDAMR